MRARPTSRLRQLARGACAVAISALVTGCSHFESASYTQYGKLLDQLWNQPSGKVSYETASLVPYASIGLQVEGEPQILLILTTALPRHHLWLSPSHIVVVTDHGRVVQTAGLGKNLSNLELSGMGSPQSALRHPGVPQHFVADFADLQAYSVSITCVPKSAKPARVKILGYEIKTLRVAERCVAPLLKWDFTDRFWLDPHTGMTWQSVQHIHPHFPAVTIQLFRPAK